MATDKQMKRDLAIYFSQNHITDLKRGLHDLQDLITPNILESYGFSRNSSEVVQAWLALQIKQGTSESINSLVVYHGTPRELDLPIVVKLSSDNDFGSGFYTSVLPEFAQSISLRENTNGIVYKLSYDDNFKLYDFKNDFEFWYLYTAENRGMIDINKYSKLQDKIKELNTYDIIIGLISDDRSQYAFNQYFDEAITDTCLIECLKYFQLGCQVVFKTQKACDKIKILEVHHNSALEVEEIEHAKRVRIGKAQDIVHELKIKYRDVGSRIYTVLERYK